MKLTTTTKDVSTLTKRTSQPHDLDAPSIVIDHLVRRHDEARPQLDEAGIVVRPADYAGLEHPAIVSAILELESNGVPVTQSTVTRVISAHLSDARDTLRELARIVQFAASTMPVVNAATAVARLADQRRLLETLQTAVAETRGVIDAETYVAELHERIDRTRSVGGAAGFPIMSAADLTAPPRPRQDAIRALDIGVGRPALLVGPGYSGKSILALDIAVSMMLGERVLGQWSASQGPVAWLDYETGSELARERFRRVCAARGHAWSDVAPHLRLSSLPGLYLNTPGVEAHLRRLAAGCVLLVVDSVRRALPGSDENDSSTTVYLDQLTRVSLATGCAVLVIHHASTKPAREGASARAAPRGSSAFFDAAGCVLVLSGEKGDPVRAEHVKAPTTGKTVDDFFFLVEDVTIDGDPRGGLAVRYRTAEQARPMKAPTAKYRATVAQVLAAIRAENLDTKNAVFTRVGGNRSNVLEAVRELERDGRITHVGGYYRAV
jgi:hypothetical protein